MKPKAILSLVAIFALLAALVLMKRSGEHQETLIEQAELAPLVPEGLDFSTINRLEIFAGAKNGERVVLTRDGEGWRINSLHGAKAVSGRPQQVLDAVEGLQGEFRATVTEDALAEYDLNDERAFHVIGFTGERDEAFHVLTGKSPKYGDMFMRASGSDSVYIVNKNIRRDAFLYSLDYDDPPKSDPWLDKRIVAIAGDDFTKVDLTMADKKIVAEKRDVASTTAESVTPEKEWVVIEGGYPGTVHQTPFRDLERYVANLTAFTVVAPEKKAIWGLDKPNNHIVMHRENGEKIELEVSHPSRVGPAYVRRTDNYDSTLYSIELKIFHALFADGGAYYDLPGFLLEEDALKTIEYVTEAGEYKFLRGILGWEMVSPSTDLPLNRAILAQMERTVSSWQATDYADAETDAGFAKSNQNITFTTDDGTHKILLGNPALHIDGFYALIDGSNDVLAMHKRDYKKLFVSGVNLFESTLIQLDDTDEIVHIELTKDGSTLTLHLGDISWEATENDESFEPNPIIVASLITAITEAKVDDITLEAPAIQGESAGSIMVKTDDGKEWAFAITTGAEFSYAVSVNGSTSTYTINQDTLNSLFPATNTFKTSIEEETVTFQAPVLNPTPPTAPAHDENDGHQH